MRYFLLTLFTLLMISPLAQAQYGGMPEGGYSFGQAKEHDHQTTLQTWAYYCGRGLISDPTNNEGNFFYGNTICLSTYDDVWHWYDWSADPDASVKISMLESQPRYTALMYVSYDPICRLVHTVVPNGWTP